MRRRSPILMLVAMLILLSGCRPSQSERATASVHAFLEDLSRGNGAAACERLSEAGLSELLFLALEQGIRLDADVRARPDACARIAGRLEVRAEAAALRRAPVNGVVLHGHRAAVEIDAGSFEVEEHEGQWHVSGFEPLAAAASRGEPPHRPRCRSPSCSRFSTAPPSVRRWPRRPLMRRWRSPARCGPGRPA